MSLIFWFLEGLYSRLNLVNSKWFDIHHMYIEVSFHHRLYTSLNPKRRPQASDCTDTYGGSSTLPTVVAAKCDSTTCDTITSDLDVVKECFKGEMSCNMNLAENCKKRKHVLQIHRLRHALERTPTRMGRCCLQCWQTSARRPPAPRSRRTWLWSRIASQVKSVFLYNSDKSMMFPMGLDFWHVSVSKGLLEMVPQVGEKETIFEYIWQEDTEIMTVWSKMLVNGSSLE